jgi:hypothetical protein
VPWLSLARRLQSLNHRVVLGADQAEEEVRADLVARADVVRTR